MFETGIWVVFSPHLARSAANPHTENLESQGFDLVRFLIFRCGILSSARDL